MNQLWRQRIVLILIISLFASIPLIYALGGYQTISKMTEGMHTQDIPTIQQVDQLIEHNRDRANAVRVFYCMKMTGTSNSIIFLLQKLMIYADCSTLRIKHREPSRIY